MIDKNAPDREAVNLARFPGPMSKSYPASSCCFDDILIDIASANGFDLSSPYVRVKFHRTFVILTEANRAPILIDLSTMQATSIAYCDISS